MSENELDADTFINNLREQRDAGISFVPLVGAGLSAPSGNPILVELEAYLVRCICRALGIDHPQAWNPQTKRGDLDLRQHYRWLPGRDDWPPYGDPQIYARDTENWKQRLTLFFVEASQSHDRNPHIPIDELKIIQEAAGASAEWRSSLLFLSRLVAFTHSIQKDGKSVEITQLRLGPPNRDIVDTFVLTVMLGRPPTLGHRMLAMLAGPLRISLALTTNFDDLLERAFADSNNPCTIFDVHIDSGLPSYRDLTGFNAIVKLHGGRFGMRADYSLDTLPSESDLRHFVSYLAGCPIDESTWRSIRQRESETPLSSDSRRANQGQPLIRSQRHLLVIGIGAKDARINEMISAAANVLTDMHVFWICYLQSEVSPAEELLKDLGVKHRHILKERFPGLLLLHAYQELTGALPSAHAVFPSAARVPVPPIWKPRKTSPSQHATTVDSTYLARLKAYLKKCNEMEPTLGADGQSSLANSRCIILHGPRNASPGGMSLGAEAFDDQLEQGHQAVWIDLDEIGSVDDLFESLIHTVARKAGIADWMPVLLRTHSHDENSRLGSALTDSQVQELARITNSPNRKWVVFLNARGGTGAHPLLPQNLDNGWLDFVDNSDSGILQGDEDKSATGVKAIELIKRIAGEECPNVSIVLLCFDGPFTDHCVPRIKPFPFRIRLATAPDGPTQQDRVATAMRWMQENSDEEFDRAQFLWSLCLGNRVRFLSMLWQWPFHDTITHPHLDTRRARTSRFLDSLEQMRVIRRKTGGFVWMLTRTRNALRRELSKYWTTQEHTSRLSASDIHHGLAESYHRIFRATEDAGAIFEIVYHRCMQANALLDLDLASFSKSAIPNALITDITSRVRSALGDAARALLRGRDCMLALGFSKSLCRRLHSTRSLLLNQTLDARLATIQTSMPKRPTAVYKAFYTSIRTFIARLKDLSFSLNYAIAIEVGENRVALKRQLQLRREKLLRLHPTPAILVAPATETNAQFDFDTLLQNSINDTTSAGPSEPSIIRWQNQDGKGEPKEEWMEFVLHLASLGIAMRSYNFTRERLEEIFQAFQTPRSFFTGLNSVNKQEPAAREWLLRNFSAGDASCRAQLKQMIIALRRYQQLVLADEMAKATWEHRRRRSSTLPPETEAVIWDYHSAMRAYETAVRIFRWLAGSHSNKHESDIPLSDIEFNLDRTWHRLFVHHAMTLAYMLDFSQAHARLNDSEALLNVSGFGPQCIERGITELIRAEVLTQQVLYSTRQGSSDFNEFGTFRYQLLKRLSGEEYGKKGMRSLLSDIVSQISINRSMTNEERNTLRNARSCLNDAWQASNRAEHSLKRYRKNVWWTTWYFELELKLAELDICAAFMDFLGDNTSGVMHFPLPHLGPESAAYAVPTLVERLLDNAERMIRFDLFRLARVVESFANSVFIGLLWTLLLQKTHPGQMSKFLASRIKLLCRRLREAEDRLRAKYRVRQKDDNRWRYLQLDSNVGNYITFTIEHCDRVCQCVSVSQEEFSANDEE